MKRRLAAILAADVVSYSRLMRDDEEATLAALKARENELVEPAISSHKGRIVKRMGDGYLVKFASAVDAVRCAIHWQENSAGNGPLRFRIGINVGDIISEDDDIYGDGVNVAARLEAMAETGGICIASTVHEQVRRHFDGAFGYLGEKPLKNIDGAVKVYGWPASSHGREQDDAGTAAPLPAGPNMLLVLPFRPVGSDPAAEDLAEALTESIAVAMAQFDELTVLDPGAVPADADVTSGLELGKKLDVLYLLAVRVQAARERVRASVQVIEVETGQRQWSDSFDRETGDVFALQDDVTAIVASTVGEALLDLMSKALDRKPEASWSARELAMRGVSHLHRVHHDPVLTAREYFQKALA